MTTAIAVDKMTQRRLARIRTQVRSLEEKLPRADRELLIRFARGRQALAGNLISLSPEGKRVLAEGDRLLLAKHPQPEELEDMIKEFPFVDAFKRDLFRNPFVEDEGAPPDLPLQYFFVNYIRGRAERIIDIASGCPEDCLECGADAVRTSIRFMRFPLVWHLGVIACRPERQESACFNVGSEAFNWRDLDFDADFGDIAVHAGGRARSVLVHYLRAGDPYAEEAARKCVAAGLKFALSLNILQRRIFPSPTAVPTEEVLDDYAARFAYTINKLAPVQIRLLADGPLNPNPHLRLPFLLEFYDKRVLPKVKAAKRGEYKLDPDIGRKFAYENIERAAWKEWLESHKESHFDLGVNREKKDGWPKISPSFVVREGRALNSPYFPASKLLHDWSPQPPGLSQRIAFDGRVRIQAQPEGLRPPAFSAARTVGETYPDIKARETVDFLRKLGFLLRVGEHKQPDDKKNERGEKGSLAVWLFYPIFNEHEKELLSGGAREVYDLVKDLPVMAEDFYYQKTVADIVDKREGERDAKFIKYLAGIFEAYRKREANLDKPAACPEWTAAEWEVNFLMSFAEGAKALRMLDRKGIMKLAIGWEESKRAAERERDSLASFAGDHDEYFRLLYSVPEPKEPKGYSNALEVAFKLLRGLPLLRPTAFISDLPKPRLEVILPINLINPSAGAANSAPIRFPRKR